MSNCFRDGGKKALARSKREDAAGGLLILSKVHRKEQSGMWEGWQKDK